jgi:hypothetical protein
MKKLLDWFSNTGLYAIALFLLAFIPLYPKLPLIDIVQTWAYIRLEDFFVAFACIILLVVKLRERKTFQTPLNLPIITYFFVVGISLVNALLFIFPKFPTDLLPHLAFLHFARRIEYISVFFLAFEAFRRKPKLWGIIAVITGTYLFVLLYGVGQKFFGFPAFLTMNEEFAKGVPLRLPSTARIPSTFGGHYDLGAFLVFMIPIMGSMIFAVRKWYLKILYILLWLGGLIVLLFTASRISFGVYLVAVSIMLIWQKKALLIIPVIIFSILILNLTSGASERFYKTFRVSNVVIDLSTGKPIGTLDKFEGTSVTLEKIEAPDEESLPKGSGFINVPAKTDVQVGQDIQKVDYFTSEGLRKGTGEMATISGSFLVQKALVYDISITTRVQGQWPRAMAAFKRNILLGSGLSSLSLAADGDYHRMLGETGILGAIAFLGIFVLSFVVFFKSKDHADGLTRAFSIGVFAGLCGLFCNAVLIDVFEASKVAFTLYLILGFTLSALVFKHPVSIPYFPLLRKILTHPIAYTTYLILAVFVIWRGSLSLYFLGDDFTWTRWAAQSSVNDIFGYFTQAQGFFYRPIPKLWYFLLFSVFWLKPFSYHLASLILLSSITMLLYVFLKEKGIPWVIAWGTAFIFTALSIHHENIFWISGHSSLLSAVFLMGSLVLLQRVWKGKSRMPVVQVACGVICVFSSMLSYDGMIVLPFILFVLSVGIYKKGKKTWPILLLIPLYWIIRTYAGALPPSGDYGYKWTTFFVNSIGNGIGYIAGILIGPKALEYISLVRLAFKQYLPHVSLVSALVAVGCTVWVVRIRKNLAVYKEGIIFILAFCISSISYLGLGNASERYAFAPSIFFIISLSLFFTHAWKTTKLLVVKILLVFIVSGITWWNIGQVQRLEGDWRKASDVAQTSLLSIKAEIYPPKKDDLVFFFINVPIRYGRAWIFPTGLADALWHMFRDNIYKVYTVPSIQSAYEFQTDKGTRYVYVFENYILKKGFMKTIEVINEK